jgi:hypothetical protein
LERLGLNWVLTRKDNQPDLADTVERVSAGAPQDRLPLTEDQLEYCHWPQLYQLPADTGLSVLKTVRPRGQRTLYAPPLLLYQLGRSRWQIDAQVFQALTVDCHFKHAAAHQDPALVVWTMIRLLAYTLTLLFAGAEPSWS